MMPSRGCLRSKDFWPCSPAIWQMCVLYMFFLSASYIFFMRLAEDNVTGVETLLDQALLVGPPSADNTTQAPRIPSFDGKIPETVVPPDVDRPEPPAIPTPPSSLPKKNDTDTHHDDIPSFNEWANKKMAEVEKNKGENHTAGTPKIRLKNYASPDCGAKVVGSNPEAVSPSAILSPSRDDYMLNPCNVKIWFVVELCESIQPQRVEIANFELFSSSPHNLSIWVSDRFPSREWSLVAVVQAQDERNIQSFPLPRLPHFAKYVKVELHSHYGSEHYCPVSLFKAYGTSELEVLDNSDNDGDDGDEVLPEGRQSVFEDGDESLTKLPDTVKGTLTKDEKKGGDDIFRTAKQAVLSIVQKVLGNGGARNNSCLNVTTSSQCLTPGYQIVCNECSDPFYYRLYDIMCCNGRKLKALLENDFVYSVVTKSPLCTTIGLEFSPKTEDQESSGSELVIGMSYLRALLGEDTLAALCNYLAISKRKAALNVSQDKGNVEEVPPGEDQSAVNETTDAPTLAASTNSSQPEIEPTISKEEPEITISPTRTLPAEREYHETTHAKKLSEADKSLSSLGMEEKPDSGTENISPDEETELANTTISPEIIPPVEPIPLPHESKFRKRRKINCLTNAKKKLFLERLVEAILKKYPDLSCDHIMKGLGYCRKLLKKCCSHAHGNKKNEKSKYSKADKTDINRKKFSYAETLISRVMMENPHFDVRRVEQTVDELLNFVTHVESGDSVETSSVSSLNVELGSLDCSAHDTAFDVIMEGVLGNQGFCDTSRYGLAKSPSRESYHSNHSYQSTPHIKLPRPPDCSPLCESCQSLTIPAPWKETDFAKLQMKLNPRDGRSKWCDPAQNAKVNSYLDDVCKNLLGGSSNARAAPKKSFSQRNPCTAENDECTSSKHRKSKSTSGKVRKEELRKCLEEICFKAQECIFKSKKRNKKVSPHQTHQSMSQNCLDIGSSGINFQSNSRMTPVPYYCQEIPYPDSWGDCQSFSTGDYNFHTNANSLEGYYDPEEYYSQSSYNHPNPSTQWNYCNRPPIPSNEPGSPWVESRRYDPMRENAAFMKCDPSEYQSTSDPEQQPLTKKTVFAERNPYTVYAYRSPDARYESTRRPNTVPNIRRPPCDSGVQPEYEASYLNAQYSPQYRPPLLNPYC